MFGVAKECAMSHDPFSLLPKLRPYARPWRTRDGIPQVFPPLPVLVHAHPKDAVPPGALEPDMVERELGDVVLHGLRGILQPNGGVDELPTALFPWAVAASYRHLKREGCLEMFGIPVLATLELEELADHHNAMLEAMGWAKEPRLTRHFPLDLVEDG
jgi:hypothetical protein